MRGNSGHANPNSPLHLVGRSECQEEANATQAQVLMRDSTTTRLNNFRADMIFACKKKVILSHIGQCMYGNQLINVRTGFRGALFLIKRPQP